MSGERKSRRRFMADLLFAGGALTAASVMGYVATHGPTPTAVETPVAEPLTPCPATPCAVETEMQPSGGAPVRPVDIQPHRLPRDPMKPLVQEQDLRPAGGLRYQPPPQPR